MCGKSCILTHADNIPLGLGMMIEDKIIRGIKGKIKLRSKQWDIAVGSVSNNLVVAVIRNGGETYSAYEEYKKPGALEVVLGRAFEHMEHAGAISWNELEYAADVYDPNRNDAVRVYHGPIRLIMMGLVWFG